MTQTIRSYKDNPALVAKVVESEDQLAAGPLVVTFYAAGARTATSPCAGCSGCCRR